MLTELPHRTIIQLNGVDKVPFLQGLVTNDVTKIDKENPVYTAFLTPQGKFLFDLFIFQVGDSWWIDCERARANALIKHLTMYKLRSQIDLMDLSSTYRVFAQWGESFTEEGIVINDPRLSQLGQRVYITTDSELNFFQTSSLSSSDLFRGSKDSRNKCENDTIERLSLKGNSSSLSAYDAHRLSLGVPDGSRDIPIDKGIILECGFDELHAIDWNKGCYMGQELTARTRYRGLVRKRLLPVLIEGNAPEPYTPVFLNEAEVGEIRTSADGYGLALLRLENIRDTLPALKCGDAILKPYVPNWMQLPNIV